VADSPAGTSAGRVHIQSLSAREQAMGYLRSRIEKRADADAEFAATKQTVIER
jgi:hypothetical protein